MLNQTHLRTSLTDNLVHTRRFPIIFLITVNWYSLVHFKVENLNKYQSQSHPNFRFTDQWWTAYYVVHTLVGRPGLRGVLSCPTSMAKISVDILSSQFYLHREIITRLIVLANRSKNRHWTELWRSKNQCWIYETEGQNMTYWLL